MADLQIVPYVGGKEVRDRLRQAGMPQARTTYIPFPWCFQVHTPRMRLFFVVVIKHGIPHTSVQIFLFCNQTGIDGLDGTRRTCGTIVSGLLAMLPKESKVSFVSVTVT